MKPNEYLVAFKRLYSQLDDIKREYHVAKVLLLIHAAWCFIIYGSTPNDYIHYEFYCLTHIERKRYITRRKALKFEKKLNSSKNAKFFNNKFEFNKKFSSYVNRDWIYLPDSNKTEFIKFIKKHKRVMLKPIDLSSGNGISVLKLDDVGNLNDVWEGLKNKKFLVEEIVKNCKELSEFNESSCNTIRVYTFVENDGNVSIINALLRIGASGSAVDNYHSGGVGAAIDVETGIIYTRLHDVNGKKYVIHPTNGSEIIGKKIPRWEELKKVVTKIARILPESRWIAWDICITKDNFEFIEGNYKGDPGFLQAIDHIGKYYIIKSKSK